jgi:hypothetical protein
MLYRHNRSPEAGKQAIRKNADVVSVQADRNHSRAARFLLAIASATVLVASSLVASPAKKRVEANGVARRFFANRYFVAPPAILPMIAAALSAAPSAFPSAIARTIALPTTMASQRFLSAS